MVKIFSLVMQSKNISKLERKLIELGIPCSRIDRELTEEEEERAKIIKKEVEEFLYKLAEFGEKYKESKTKFKNLGDYQPTSELNKKKEYVKPTITREESLVDITF